MSKLKKIFPYLYVLPAASFITVLFLYSAVFTLYISFTNWKGYGQAEWVGLANYIRFFQDPVLLTSFTNTILWVVATLLIPVGLGLILSVVLQNMWGHAVFKNIFYLPYGISLTITAIIWGFLFSPLGINSLLAELGIHWKVDWLNTPPYNTYSMIMASIWQSTGTNMILFLVGLQSLPKDPFEAAMIDGASRFRTFISVTVPLLKPYTIVVAGMALVNSFKVFDIIWVMTQGGPYRSSETLAVTMYRESFVLANMGQGSAVSMILTVMVFLFSWLYLRKTIQKGEDA
ncbi:sugar ABC transporter permease [Paenibacillus cisolokensis]|jgi:multiple sugar transport system permease protein|uniref:carbohydrate ABC transporter permease n=1 Tax=Paenibacillus TaxID=44249 RepID=UPI00072197C8|nr:sugar ABC transporter permease [Paenibacillus sp. 32O-W]ALS25587.1 sugar ABC transporter permease [Paenibacillus sp. 32O-W]